MAIACGKSASAIPSGDELENYVEIRAYADCRCKLERRAQFLNNKRFRELIIRNYGSKRINNVIYIMATAFCYLIKVHGMTQFAITVTRGDFGLTNILQTWKKIIDAGLIAYSGPMYAR